MSFRALRLLLGTASGSCVGSVERRTVAGLPALVAGQSDAGATLVFANACTLRGIDEPAVVAFVGAAARAGLNVVAPELPDVAAGRITPETVEALVRVAVQCEGTLVLAGASTGGGLAIVAAADPRIAGRVERVSAVAPFANLTNVLRLATTGHYLEDDTLFPYAVEPRLRWAAERSLYAVGGTFIESKDPERFDDFHAALPTSTRAAINALSPVNALPDVLASVDVVCDPRDTFFPPCEPRALERAGARVTATAALGHVRPRPSLGLARLLAFTDRMLVVRPALAV